MNRSDKALFDARIADWLEDDPHTAPDQALEIVLAAFPSIKQRRAARVPWRFFDMSSPLKLAFGLAAIAVVVGGVLFLGPWRPATNVAAPPTASPPTSPSAATATSSPALPPVTGLPGTFVFRRDDGQDGNVFLMQPDRSGLAQLTTGPTLDSAPALSPDGTRVAFERSDAAGAADIWVVNADGTKEMAVTRTDQFEDWPSWSPDGTRLMFTRASMEGGHGISEIVIRTISPTAQLEPPEADTVVFRHEGSAGASAILSPTWSPDGSLVAFVSDLDGESQLYTIGVDGSNLRKLTTAGATSRPAWSPDSSTIAYQVNRIDGCVWLVGATGDHSRAVAGDHCTDGPVAWSPDGTMVAWAGGGDMAPIWAVNVDGTDLRRLTADDRYGDLGWGGGVAP
jgi:dipeptidyl aminopeptidase/acylaminoacyl peptidase